MIFPDIYIKDSLTCVIFLKKLNTQIAITDVALTFYTVFVICSCFFRGCIGYILTDYCT